MEIKAIYKICNKPERWIIKRVGGCTQTLYLTLNNKTITIHRGIQDKYRKDLYSFKYSGKLNYIKTLKILTKLGFIQWSWKDATICSYETMSICDNIEQVKMLKNNYIKLVSTLNIELKRHIYRIYLLHKYSKQHTQTFEEFIHINNIEYLDTGFAEHYEDDNVRFKIKYKGIFEWYKKYENMDNK